MPLELKNINGNGDFTLVNTSNGGGFSLVVTGSNPSPSFQSSVSITPTITPSLSSGIMPSSGCWQNIIVNVTTAGFIKYRIDSCGSATYGYLTTYFGLGEYTLLPCIDISTLSPDEGQSPSAVFTVVSSGTSCFVPTPTVTPSISVTPSITRTPSITPTPTPTPTPSPAYDFYLADEYACNFPGCTLQNTNVPVAFPSGFSYIGTHYYSDIGHTGFVYKITSPSSYAVSVILDTAGSNTNCSLACTV